MYDMLTVFQDIFFNISKALYVLVASFFVFVLLQIIPVFTFIKVAYSMPGLSTQRYFEIIYQYVFEPFGYITFIQQAITILLSVAIVVNFILFFKYIIRQRKIFSGKGFLGTFAGIFLGMFGLGCVSCGALVVTPLLSIIGLGSFAYNIIEYSVVISAAGLILVIFSILYLLKILSKPLVCK